MQSLTIPTLKQFLDHVAIRLREPVFVWGQPGVGKSEAIHQLTQSVNGTLVDVRMSQYDSVDFRGIPAPNDATATTVWYMPATLPFKGNPAFDGLDDRPIILFLDEMNSAAASVQAVGYQLVNDGRVGEHVLRDNVVVIAAGNRETDKGVTTRMPTPLANRFTHVEAIVDPDAWCFWAQDAGLDPVGIAYIQFQKSDLSTFDPSKPEKAFATPRTWAKALRYYSDGAMPEHIKMAAMDGAIGPGVAAKFWGFVDVWRKMPSIKDIIANPLKVDVPTEPSMQWAVSIACSGAMTTQTTAPLHTYLKRIGDEHLTIAWQLSLKRDPKLHATPQFVEMGKLLKGLI